MHCALIDRRLFLKATLAGAATATAPGVFDRSAAWAAASAAARDGAFGYGVASGDPLGTAVVLWTRVTPTPDAVPGSGVGGPVNVIWEASPSSNAIDPAGRPATACGSVGDSTGSQLTAPASSHGVGPPAQFRLVPVSRR